MYTEMNTCYQHLWNESIRFYATRYFRLETVRYGSEYKSSRPGPRVWTGRRRATVHVHIYTGAHKHRQETQGNVKRGGRPSWLASASVALLGETLASARLCCRRWSIRAIDELTQATESNTQHAIATFPSYTVAAMASAKDTAKFFQHGTASQFEHVLSLYPQALKLKAEKKTKKPEELIKLDNW